MSTLASIPAATPSAILAAPVATILIVEDTPFWQKQIAQALKAAGYATVIAGNGVEAMSLIETHKPDLVVSDVEMPQMGGLELMKALRAKPQWQKLPIFLLTTGAAKERVIEATRLRAAEYMLKARFSVEQIGERVKKWLELSRANTAPAATSRPSTAPVTKTAAAPVACAFPRLLERPAVMAGIAAQVAEGMTLPGVLAQVNELCKSASDNSAPLLEIVKHDPILAMRVLQQSNTAKRVGTVDEAVRIVGVEGISLIAKSLGAYSTTSRRPPAIWRHSIAVASVMHKIVPRSFEMSIGVAYLTGLLHDLPEIILRQAFPGQCEAATDYAEQANRTLRQILPDVFGTSLSEIATEVYSLLKLPQLISVPLREYAAATETRNTERPSPLVERLAMAIRFAEYYANALGFTPSPAEAFIAPLTLAECRAAYVGADAINGGDIAELVASASARIMDNSAAPIASSTARPRIWYVRHGGYAALDPIEEALKRLADVQTHAEPPARPEDFTGIKAIVLAAPSLDAFGVHWHAVDRLPAGWAHHSRILYLLPSHSAPADSKVAGNDCINILRYPFPQLALEDALKCI
jgi:two-component system chemotaxis response regulator CheY